ncbi:hypothetical protein GOP47_0029327 [Adiantum capillus-veneris]|nr:hypothetical protein GOP47_0029327 [Adiantum capillus-veneris]
MARKRTASAPKHGPTAAMVKHKATSPAVKFADWRANSGERMAIMRAKVAEKAAYARASMRATFIRIRHPVHPVRRVAAKEAARETKAAATERRRQAEARARTISSQKKALVRERRAKELNRSVA